MALIANWLEPIAQPNPISGEYIGGAGGGGGLHVITGLLVDLPDSVPVTVGQAGADGNIGQYHQLAPWDPSPVWSAGAYPRMSHARWDFLNRFPNGRPTIGAPTPGEDGGTSSFGDIAKASGGTGGGEAIGWDGGISGTALHSHGWGGDGGIGGSGVPASPPYLPKAIPAEDGHWDGTIGSGGGGGYGGIQPGTPASDGGRGSYSFRDTTVFGPKGRRGLYTVSIVNYTEEVIQIGPPGDYVSYGVYVGDPLSTNEVLIPSDFNPGSGGGARVNPINQKHQGSHAKGAFPDGAVFIRIFDKEIPA